MLILNDAREFVGKSSVVALGTFDGVHLGHRALIARAKELAREHHALLVALTSDRHPLTLLKPDAAPAPLLSPDEKRACMETLGVEALVEQPFTADFAALPPDVFAGFLRDSLRPRAVVVGYNYTFGRGGRGDADALVRFAAQMGFAVEIIPAFCVDGEPVSSSRIRAALERGDAPGAAQLMGSSSRDSLKFT